MPNDMDLPRFRADVRARRKQQHMTQEALARLMDVEVSTVARFEQGRHQPSMKTLLAAADVLGLSLDAYDEAVTSPVTGSGQDRQAMKTPHDRLHAAIDYLTPEEAARVEPDFKLWYVAALGRLAHAKRASGP